ncbi:MAG: class I SAM-dependent methyltransferase [Deltaproteobacteria bacterium]|nr:class I SAM-dependent methyltransferase [Deltaproteobacteria bacterium]
MIDAYAYEETKKEYQKLLLCQFDVEDHPGRKMTKSTPTTIADPWDHHDWSSQAYAKEWAARQDASQPHRDAAFDVLAKTLPFAKSARIKILDIGTGYGALAGYLLRHFKNGQAVCQDGSAEMLALAREHLVPFEARVKFVRSDLSGPGWSKKLKAPFDAVVSSIAIHNVRAHGTIQRIYADSFALLKPGGCFLNLDRMRPSVEEQLQWLRAAGFVDVKRFWDGGKRALVGGFKR